jgi:hypothetical protein
MSLIAKINGEIRSCLARIESGGPALAQLADTLEHLRSDPSWSAREIREVEFGVRHILSKIVIPVKKGREPRGQISSPPLSIPSTDAAGRHRPIRDPLRVRRPPGRDRQGPESDAR